MRLILVFEFIYVDAFCESFVACQCIFEIPLDIVSHCFNLFGFFRSLSKGLPHDLLLLVLLLFFLLADSSLFLNKVGNSLKFFFLSLEFFLSAYLHELHRIQAFGFRLCLILHPIDFLLELLKMCIRIYIPKLAAIFPKFFVQFLELLVPNRVDFVDRVLDGLLVVLAKAEETLNVLALRPMP